MANHAHTSAKPVRARSPNVRRCPPPRLEQLPAAGRGRWQDIAPFVGLSREKWRQLVNQGKAPPALRLSARCTLYDFAAVHEWIADPANFMAKEAPRVACVEGTRQRREELTARPEHRPRPSRETFPADTTSRTSKSRRGA